MPRRGFIISLSASDQDSSQSINSSINPSLVLASSISLSASLMTFASALRVWAQADLLSRGRRGIPSHC